MAAKKPPPQTLQPDEERKVQMFLERAAPLVLESRVLDLPKWQQLLVLAAELELTEAQVRATIDDLQQRGVIEQIDLSPPPAPPLPPDSESQGPNQEIDSGFALTPPPPPPPKSPPKPPESPPSAPPKDRANSKPRRWAESDETDPQLPGSLSVDRPPVPEKPAATNHRSSVSATPSVSTSAKETEFALRVAAILAEHRGLTPKSRAILEATAADYGLGPAEIQRAIRNSAPEARSTPEVKSPAAIRSSAQVTAEPEVVDPEAAAANSRWRVEGEPLPSARPSKRKPHETFREFVGQSLAKFADKSVSADLEDGIIKHGTKVLRLAESYARQIVLEIAAERGLSVETVEQQTEEPPEVDDSTRQFLEKAGPILAEHRGITPKSRVLLTAVAQEVGLTEEQMDSAVASLQSSTSTTSSTALDIQKLNQARIQAYEEHLRAALPRLPRGILGAEAEAHLIDQGVDLFGLTKDVAAKTVRRVAESMDLTIISEDKAVCHLEGLIDQAMRDSLRLSADVRERIMAEGTNWGLAQKKIESVIRERTRANYRRHRSEQRLTNAALTAAGVAVLLVLGFLGWAMIGGRMSPRVPPQVEAAEKRPIVPKLSASRDDAWWDGELSLAVSNARDGAPLQRRNLNELSSKEADRRGRAYQQLVAAVLAPNTNRRRLLLINVLASCFALEPDQDAAKTITSTLLAVVPGPDEGLSDNVADYEKMFWGMKGAVDALTKCDADKPRSEELALELSRVLGTNVSSTNKSEEFRKECLASLAERLFRRLIANLDTDSDKTPAIRKAIVEQASDYLDPGLIDRLNADFLVAYLREADERWEEFDLLLMQTIQSEDPLAVITMLEPFEATSNERLQQTMGDHFVNRAPGFSSGTVEELADHVRSYLGVNGAEARPEGRAARFAQLARRNLREEESKDNKALMEQTLRLLHLATLGCAVEAGESGNRVYEELMRSGPGSLDVPLDEMDLGEGSTPTLLDPSKRRQFKRWLDSLSDSRTTWVERANSFKRIAGQAERLADLEIRDAVRVVSYILKDKTESQEQAQIETQIEAVALWKNVRLVLADHLEDASISREELQRLFEKIFGEPISLVDDEGYRQMRVRLLRSVLAETASNSSGSRNGSFDVAQAQMLKYYKFQAELFGVPLEEDPSSVSQVLRSLIDTRVTQLQPSLPEELRPQLQKIPHEVRAAEYLAANNMQLTILLERIWLKCLSLETSQMDLRDAGRLAEIEAELQNSDRSANNMVKQLYHGQAAIVQVWLLRST